MAFSVSRVMGREMRPEMPSASTTAARNMAATMTSSTRLTVLTAADTGSSSQLR